MSGWSHVAMVTNYSVLKMTQRELQIINIIKRQNQTLLLFFKK